MAIIRTKRARGIRRHPKPDDKVMENAERHHAKAAGLVAGAAKLLTDFINGCSWGTDIAIDAAILLLEDARREQRLAVPWWSKHGGWNATIGERPSTRDPKTTRSRRQTRKRKA